MRTLITSFVLLWSFVAGAATVTNYTVLVAVTNASGTTNGQTLTVNSDTRTFTNQVFVMATQVLTNSTAAGSADNLRAHLGSYPFAGLSIFSNSTTTITLKTTNGAAPPTAAMSAGWGTITLGTNVLTDMTAVRVPYFGEPALAQQTNVTSGVAAMILSPQNTNKFSLIQVSTSPTNWIIDATGTPLQRITATNDINIQFITNGPGLVWLEILPNGADRLLTVPTNWVMLNTNAWSRSGPYWASTVTNTATTGTGPRRFLLRMLLDDLASSQTNVIAEGFLSPSPAITGSGGSGTVTSVDASVPAEFSISGNPITTSGTLAIGKANESANTVWAGPTTGGATAPTFRSLVLADLPGSITASTLAANATIGASDGGALTNLTYRYTTNAFTARACIWGAAVFTNIAANFTLSIPAPANNFFETAVLWITNSSASDFTVTMPNGVLGTPGSGTPPVYYCTNKQLTRIMVEHYGQLSTNAYKLDFAP